MAVNQQPETEKKNKKNFQIVVPLGNPFNICYIKLYARTDKITPSFSNQNDFSTKFILKVKST